MGAEDAIEEDDDDVDFNPYLQLSPSLDGGSGDSSEGEDDVELEVQEESQNREDIENLEKEAKREKDLDEEDFLELGSDDYEEEDIEDEEQDKIVQCRRGNSKLGEHSTKSISLQKDGKHIPVQSRLDTDEDNNNVIDVGVAAIDQDADGVKQSSEGDESPFRTRNLGSSKISDGFDHETETGSPRRSIETLPELRLFRRGIQSEEILRGDSSEDIGDDSVDAIFKRTRAHYSLADMSLDQLEMFLQESDEEEYFQNVDDEEEYRKFLLAVQEKQDEGDEQCELQDRKEDEDDEEEDADFEFEIEEALESDYEDAAGFTRKRKRRRPETRENRRQRAKSQSKVLHLNQSKAPLRPLLPHISNLTYSLGEKRKITDGADQVWAPNLKKKVPVNGFTAHQIGQLHCIIHEHVQLLVQVYSMCVLEPSRQQITNDTRRMLMELAEKRDVLLSWKKTAFPDFCFRPPCTHPSFTENEEETPTHRFQFPSDPAASNVATCSTDTTGGSEAYPLSLGHGSNRDMVSWSLGESGSSLPAVPSGHLTTFSSSNPGDLVSETCSVSGTSNSMVFLHDDLSHMSHLWHQPFSISQTPGQCKLREANRTYASDRSSESTFVHVGASYGDGKTPVKSISPATTHVSNSSSLVTSSKAPQSFSVYGDEGLKQVKNVCSEWAPAICGPVRSLLDVAPLALIREFLDDMSRVAEDYRQRHVESGAYHSECEREPLFTIPMADHHEGDARRNSNPRTSPVPINGEVLPSSGPRIQIKKTMAAALVESTKKESLALVPKDVAKALQCFLPFFNPALFPHKPPPFAAANRLLFTDAEDELLAMGLMTYNTDWTAIRQRFLPSKSMHQIFVRQKNRSSARAPENSIKAVRRMKSSPLTTVEKACIQEGLKIYKYDWHKVWEFCVPHRDPAVLPRQWRIALGTQKSYKTSETSKERRRLYEANRRLAKKAIEYGADIKKAAGPSSVETGIGGRNVISGEEDGCDEEAYIREAFLADWCPSQSPSVGASVPPPGGPHTQRPKVKSSTSKKKKPHVDQVPNAKRVSSVPLFDLAPGSSTLFNRQALMFSSNIAKQTVKLAPGLPSVKLPPHVHVLSQALVPNLPLPSNNATGEFPVNSGTIRWSHSTGQKWPRMTGQSTETAMPVNPPRYLTSTSLPKNISRRFRGNMQTNRATSKPAPSPAEQVGSPSQSIPQQSRLHVATGPANSTVTTTSVDLRRLAKDLDTNFRISQPRPWIDMNQLHTPVSSSAEVVEVDSSSVHALPSREIQPVSSQIFGRKFFTLTGDPLGSGPTSLGKPNRLLSRRRKEKLPVVSSSSPNAERISPLPEGVSQGTQKCDLPQTCILGGTSSSLTLARDWEIYSAPALTRSNCETSSDLEPSSDDPLKVTEAHIERDVAHQMVAGSPIDPRYPSIRRKEQQAPVRGSKNRKGGAKRSRKLSTIKQLASTAKPTCNKQDAAKDVCDSTIVGADDFDIRGNCLTAVPEAGFVSGHRRRKQKNQESVETRVEDPNLDSQVIVMEQEELSDSEDEAGIGVEFEHEEMGDSDKDVELELGACDQTKESSIEFEEEEIESDKEKEEDSLTREHSQQKSKEILLLAATKPSTDTEICRSDHFTPVQISTHDDGQSAGSFRTKTSEYAKTTTEELGDCTGSMTSCKTSTGSKRKQVGRVVKSRARGKSKDLELNASSSHQVHKRRGHDFPKNTRAREKKMTEAEDELASDETAIAAAEVLAVIRQVPPMSRR